MRAATRSRTGEAGFRVLRAPDVPSVLVELGYLSSRKDIDLLTSDDWRDTADRRHGGGDRPLFRDAARRAGRLRRLSLDRGHRRGDDRDASGSCGLQPRFAIAARL